LTSSQEVRHEDLLLDTFLHIHMVICMRTTLVLEDALLRQAKRRATERNMTVSELVNEALRESLARPRATAPPFSMVTYGRGSAKVHHEPADLDAALEDFARYEPHGLRWQHLVLE